MQQESTNFSSYGKEKASEKVPAAKASLFTSSEFTVTRRNLIYKLRINKARRINCKQLLREIGAKAGDTIVVERQTAEKFSIAVAER